MENNYEIKIEKLYCAPTLKDGDKDYENLVTRVEYKWVGTSDSGAIGFVRYTKDLNLPGEDYVSFDELVEDDVKVWVNVDAERDFAISKIDEQIIIAEENKFKETLMPWMYMSDPDPKTNS